MGAGLPAIAAEQALICQLTVPYRSIDIYTTLWAVAANGNHDAKRVALDLLLILISGAPLNHAGRTQA
ncbi:hypothetical protein PflCFBP13510_29200 [Pseudomonas fluorescens]|nr:hypothetical protein PflCFBP13510_29200 [Pseudomonas fluorescens]